VVWTPPQADRARAAPAATAARLRVCLRIEVLLVRDVTTDTRFAR
jgi:hypothetical protein